MSYYWKLKKLDYYMVAIELKNKLKELEKSDSDSIADRLRGSNLQFYKYEKSSASFWIRLTLPFAVILFILLFISLPINYIISGKWGYQLKWVTNWFNALGW